LIRCSKDGIWLKFLFYTCTLFEQCTYLGYLLLEAPRDYVQHGPLLSINWLRLCPQFGARVQSCAVRRRLFIVLMTAAHISPNVFSLQNFLSNIHGLFLMIHSTSFIPIIHHIYMNNYTFYLHDTSTLFISPDLHGRLAALDPLCPIQV
jgi:hypothetical protein